jgi:hypothetical protein
MCKEGVWMSKVTFVSPLSAYSHAGFQDEWLVYFDSMGSVYGVSATVKHCACMVDLLDNGFVFLQRWLVIHSSIFIHSFSVSPYCLSIFLNAEHLNSLYYLAFFYLYKAPQILVYKNNVWNPADICTPNYLHEVLCRWNYILLFTPTVKLMNSVGKL